MTKQYSLDEIKEMVYKGMVNVSNFNQIMSNLLDYDFNEEIKNMFIYLSKNGNLPATIRINLKSVIDSYDEIKKETKKENNQEYLFEDPVTTLLSNENISLLNNNEKKTLENERSLKALTTTATNVGLKVVETSSGVKDKPSISFELNNDSKPYIDNLLINLYDNNENVNVEMEKIASTNQELLTISIDDSSLNLEQMQEKSKKLFTNINNIINSTDSKRDYEKDMPGHLKALKDKFVNDDPNIPDKDFKVGYSNSNGGHSFYLITDNKQEAIELAELMGYSIKKDRGGNVFELDTNGRNMEGTKLDKVTENINDIDEVKDTRNGISDLDIDYNNRHYQDGDENYKKIENFINDNRDPSTMSVVQIEVPNATPSQRVVTLASTDGTRETIIFNDGKDFDGFTLPKIANAYGNGTSIDTSNATKTEYGNGKAGYDALSSDNTYLRLYNFDSEVIGKVENTISKYSAMKDINANTKENAYTKTLGTYPVSNKEAANTSFTTLIVFCLVMILGMVVIYIVFGG